MVGNHRERGGLYRAAGTPRTPPASTRYATARGGSVAARARPPTWLVDTRADDERRPSTRVAPGCGARAPAHSGPALRFSLVFCDVFSPSLRDSAMAHHSSRTALSLYAAAVSSLSARRPTAGAQTRTLHPLSPHTYTHHMHAHAHARTTVSPAHVRCCLFFSSASRRLLWARHP